MRAERLKVYGVVTMLDRSAGREVSAERAANRFAEVSPGRPLYRILWCWTKSLSQ